MAIALNMPDALRGRAAVRVSEFAALVGCTPTHIYNEIARGHIATFTLGKSRRIAGAEILRLMGEGGGPDVPAA